MQMIDVPDFLRLWGNLFFRQIRSLTQHNKRCGDVVFECLDKRAHGGEPSFNSIVNDNEQTEQNLAWYLRCPDPFDEPIQTFTNPPFDTRFTACTLPSPNFSCSHLFE